MAFRIHSALRTAALGVAARDTLGGRVYDERAERCFVAAHERIAEAIRMEAAPERALDVSAERTARQRVEPCREVGVRAAPQRSCQLVDEDIQRSPQ